MSNEEKQQFKFPCAQNPPYTVQIVRVLKTHPTQFKLIVCLNFTIHSSIGPGAQNTPYTV